MKALLVLVIILLGAATAFAYGRADMADGLSAVVDTTNLVLTEPVLLLLSGALLLVLGGAVRRFSV